MKKLVLPFLFFTSLLHAQVKWEKQFRLSGNAFTVIESASQVVETPDKGYLVAGNGRAANERPFGFLMKVSANGDSLWSRVYDSVSIPRVASLFYNRNNELMCVLERLIAGQKTDIIFAKINANNGDTSESFIVPKPFGIGGHAYRKHVELADGSYIVAGQDNSATSMGAGSLVRFMPGSSTPVWAADSLARRAAVFYDMILDGDKLVLAGTNASVLLKSNFYITKYSLDGKTEWQRTLIFPGEWAPASAAYALRKNQGGNYVVSGHWVIKPEMILMAGAATAVIGPGGDSLAMYTEPAKSYSIVRSMIQTSDGFYGAGLINGVVKAEGQDYAVGFMGAFRITDQGTIVLMNKFNNTGVVKEPGGFAASNADAAGLIATSDGDLLVFGHTQFYDSTTANKMQQCTYLVKYKPEQVAIGLKERLTPSNLAVYPNPSNAFIVIGEQGKTMHQLTITDITGRVVYLQQQLPGTERINTSGLKPGHYFITCTSGEQLYTGRFIKTE